MKPLEDRFPTLYYDIVHVREAGKDEVKEQRTPKETKPGLFEVVEAVCSTHRVTDLGLMKDLASSITEFQGSPKAAAKAKGKAGKIQMPGEDEEE